MGIVLDEEDISENGAFAEITIEDNSWKAAPTNLAVQDYGGGDIILSWEHVSDDVAYEIAENGTALKQTSVGQKMTALSNQAYGSHTYEVYAVKDGDRGTGATVTFVYANPGQAVFPDAPKNFTAVRNGDYVDFSWDYYDMSAVSNGRIIIGAEDVGYVIGNVEDLTATSYSARIITAMQGTHAYYVRGLDLNGDFGEKSNTVELTIT